MAEQRDDNNERVRKRPASRKGVPILMLVLGLIAGAAGGFFLHRSGLFEQVLGVEPSPTPTPTPTPVIERVTVETVRTPRQCLVAIDGLRDALDDLEDLRRRLMEADIARSGGNQEIANRAYSDVDQGLRAALIALQAKTLQTAIDECHAKADEGTSSAPSPAPPTPAHVTPTPEERLTPQE